MGGDMWLVLAWTGLGLVAHSTYAYKYSSLSDETIKELEEELKDKGEDDGVFDDDEQDLFDLLASSEEESSEEEPEPVAEPKWDSKKWDSKPNWDSKKWDSKKWDSKKWDSKKWDSKPKWESKKWDTKPKWDSKPKWKPNWKPKWKPRESSGEVIESIDEIKSMTPITKIEEVKSITPVKSVEEVKSITPIESIEEVKSMKEIKSILPVPDDIAKKFIRDNNLVPTDGGSTNDPETDIPDDSFEEVSGPLTEIKSDLLEALQEGVITIQAALDKISAQGLELCGTKSNPEIDDWDSMEPISRESTEPLDSDEIPFSPEDVTDIQEITAMEEVKSMLPIKSIDEIKSITPIKSIKEVKGLYELTDRQAQLLRKLNRRAERGYGGYGRYGSDED